jgi:hypothetical protein
VFLSFLERERDRTVTVFDYSFQSVTAFRLDRSYVFLTVHRSSAFLTVPERFMSGFDHKTVENARERSGTVNGQGR